jgi:sigma-B regulation protein RsbU (phosphoserine phosphatase)
MTGETRVKQRLRQTDTRTDLPALRRVLVVDDSRLDRRILRAPLERWGYEVTEAASAEAALALCRQGEFDFVLSDWVMPGMSGPDFCRAFRALPREVYGYFILLTVRNETSDAAEGLDAGADDFLSKPLDADELRARLQAGARLLEMQRDVNEKNRLLSDALTELQEVHDALDRDIAEARKLQQSLVGNRQAEFGQASIALMLHPSGHVGGDLVGWMPLSSRRVAFYAIDVSGHGVASAMMAARLAGILGGASGRGDLAFALAEPAPDRHILPPEAVLARLNRMVLEVMVVEQYFTCVWCDADLETGEVAIAQAGHPHPLLLRADGRVERVGRGGLPVGLVAEATHESVHLRLNPGDRLFLMSDGLLDVTGRDGGTLGEEGLIALARRNRALTGGAFLDALMWDVERLAGGGGGERSRRDAARAGEDDISGVLFCWHGPTGPR